VTENAGMFYRSYQEGLETKFEMRTIKSLFELISLTYLCITRLNLISETRTAKFGVGTYLISSIHVSVVYVSSSNGCQALGLNMASIEPRDSVRPVETETAY
jgi:hypothetical protein